MRRNATRRNRREERMRIARQIASEEPIDPRPAELSRRQADVVDHDELDPRTRRPLVEVIGQHLTRPEQEAGGAIDSQRLRGFGHRAGSCHNGLVMNPPPEANEPYVTRDLAHVWHPCTQMKDHERVPLIPIRRGQGVWLEDFAGKRYLDAVSSWWVNLFGHSNPRINAAVASQLEHLEQVILAGFTHEPVIELSEALTAVVPRGLTRCFYADNGSSAVEVALKMSFHYWRNEGHTAKRRF